MCIRDRARARARARVRARARARARPRPSGHAHRHSYAKCVGMPLFTLLPPRPRINSVKNEMALQRASSGHLEFTNVFIVFSSYHCTLTMSFTRCASAWAQYIDLQVINWRRFYGGPS